jgi:hypothetical protein
MNPILVRRVVSLFHFARRKAAMIDASHLPVAILLAAVMISGCVTDPRAVGEENRTDIPVGPIELQAVTLDNGLIRLRWIQRETIETYISYRLTWEPLNTDRHTDRDFGTEHIIWSDGSPFEANGRAYLKEIGPLTPGEFYLFHLYAKRSGEPEEDIVHTIQAAPAQWYHRDAARPDERIRIYEKGSTLGSGLVLDPALGGPTRVTPGTAPPGGVQLALGSLTPGGGPEWYIIAASQSEEYAAPGLADSTTLISGNTATLTSFEQPLSLWLLRDGDFERVRRTLSESNRIYLIPDYSSRQYAGAIISFGTGPDFTGPRRYARICAVSQDDGVMIRGTAPNRYVEVDISLGYPGIPWA